MTDEQNIEKDEVEGQGARAHIEPAREVEGQPLYRKRSDAESPEEKAEEKGDESRDADDEPEVEGQGACRVK